MLVITFPEITSFWISIWSNKISEHFLSWTGSPPVVIEKGQSRGKVLQWQALHHILTTPDQDLVWKAWWRWKEGASVLQCNARIFLALWEVKEVLLEDMMETTWNKLINSSVLAVIWRSIKILKSEVFDCSICKKWPINHTLKLVQ